MSEQILFQFDLLSCCLGIFIAGIAGFVALQKTRERLVRAEAEKDALQQQFAQRSQDLKALEDRFENLSNQIFTEKTRVFEERSQKNLDQLLSPLKDKINDFQKKVDDAFSVHGKEQFALKEEIKRIADVNREMTLQAESLTKALKSDSKAQGNWGEIILERILEESGLRKDKDYVVQGKDMGLKHPETGRATKPDVIIKLPEHKHIIIDSKVTLTHYEEFTAAEEENEQALAMKKFLASVRARVLELEDRRYQDTEGLGTPDFVLMFMPIEGAFMLALSQDTTLQDYAWGKKVVIVCPSTLFATLRTIESVWRLERQNKNALEIARQGGALYDKIAGFVSDMDRLGKQIGIAGATYDDAMKKLSDGRGNILARTEKLKSMGAQASKSLPADLVDPEDHGPEFDENPAKTGT